MESAHTKHPMYTYERGKSVGITISLPFNLPEKVKQVQPI